MTRALLHDYFRSSAAYRVRIALNLKGIEYDRHAVNLVEGEQKAANYLALNPQGFVPMLEIDDLKLTQSLSIIVYLDQTRPDPPLMPRDPADGAHVRAMALAVACDIHPLNNLRVLKYLSKIGIEQDQRDEWYRHWIREGFGAIERQARRKLLMLDAAHVLDDLRRPPGNRLEALRGDRAGQHSIRINDQWRVCFIWRDGDAYDVSIVDYH